ncbi:MAG: hypothetical protein WD737_10205 [Gemmatimonadota bacterium]
MRNASPPVLRIEHLDPGLVPVFRAMSSAERVAAGLSATDLIRERLRATIQEVHPEWSSEAIAEAASRRTFGARH